MGSVKEINEILKFCADHCATQKVKVMFTKDVNTHFIATLESKCAAIPDLIDMSTIGYL